jgi:hypothetical protein
LFDIVKRTFIRLRGCCPPSFGAGGSGLARRTSRRHRMDAKQDGLICRAIDLLPFGAGGGEH